MPAPDFDALSDALFDQCDAVLGDPIQYKAGADEPRDIKVQVDYGEALRDIGNNQIVDNEITIRALKSVLPVKPTANDRLFLPKIPAFQYVPINVLDMGREWTFGVKRRG